MGQTTLCWFSFYLCQVQLTSFDDTPTRTSASEFSYESTVSVMYISYVMVKGKTFDLMETEFQGMPIQRAKMDFSFTKQ